MNLLKVGLFSLCLMQFAACSTQVPPVSTAAWYPVLTPCNKPVFSLSTNQDLVFALEKTELARAQCAAQVDAIIKIQEQSYEKAQ
ncbi:Rz1-like lysis system protein LysC [Acinetobacter towneri]|uniref:Rz1-like lysis system protein LysC n=1 Tax=Acinetobacter towneri TaxID=202956 RepID=UPI00336BF0BB